jgi:hypothetical protein
LVAASSCDPDHVLWCDGSHTTFQHHWDTRRASFASRPSSLRAPCPNSGFGSLYAHVSDCEQFVHHIGLFHGDLLHSLDITDPIAKNVDDLDVLDVRHTVPGVTKTFHVVPKTFIVLMPDGLKGLCCRRTLVCAMEVPNEHGAWLVPRSDRSFAIRLKVFTDNPMS